MGVVSPATGVRYREDQKMPMIAKTLAQTENGYDTEAPSIHTDRTPFYSNVAHQINAKMASLEPLNTIQAQKFGPKINLNQKSQQLLKDLAQTIDENLLDLEISDRENIVIISNIN